MTPPPNTPRLPNEGQTYPATIRAPNTAALSPRIQHPSTRNNVARNSHQKNSSVTSNPIQRGVDAGSAQEEFQGPAHFDADYTQPYDTEPDFMSGTYSFDHDFESNTQQSFAFGELMTPEYSDNHISEHTTPQELIWEREFHPHIYQQNDFGSPQNPQSPSNEFTGVFSALDQDPEKIVSGSQLPSPQLTSPSPPEAPTRPAAPSQTVADTPIMGEVNKKRAGEPLHLSTNPSALAPRANGTSSKQRPVSPSVVITSHTRGDSPNRPIFPRARSYSKRSRESGLHHPYDEEHSSASRSPHLSPIDNSASRLMPPDPFESQAHDHDQERSGIDPGQRGVEQVVTINELAEQRKITEKNAEVEDWLSKSETGSVADESDSASRRRGRTDRPRAHSTGIRTDAMGPIYSDRGIPGPGVLINEDSQDEYSEGDSASVTGSEASAALPESPPISEQKLKDAENSQSYFPSFEDDNIPPEEQEPLPKQFLRRAPWQDPVRGPISDDTRDQPPTSNAAAMRFNQEAARWETASRAATWGTRRRLSESEVSSIVDGSRVRHLSLAKRGRERGNTLLNKARGLIPRRSNSNIKKGSESPPKDKSPELEAPSRRDTGNSMKPISRISSFGKSKPPKSPPLDTSGAFMAMSGNLAAVGQGSTPVIESPFQKPEGLRSPLQMLRKVRSKSDVGKSPSKSASGLADLFTKHGGPPMPTLASPAQHSQQLVHKQPTGEDGGMDDDDDEMMDDAGIKMDFKVQAENIIPNYEGFKIHARQLNPRLEPYLIDRIGQEQVRRYKKLIDTKIKHTKAVQITQKCSSGKFCFGLGGDAALLPPRVSTKDPDATCAQFQVTNPADEEIDDTAFEEGVVTPALFPPGIPLPPVKRLPAEFECILCFKVKKFQKPSDWTKHVHEDIQPFSCTFPNCNEPKSFKRKADWVRHENERHRRLEYWKCNVSECSHICYRKDNFVQHLVREHKKTEPKIKSRASGSSKNKPPGGNGWQSEDSEVWRLVDSCRFETSSKPRDEPCRFCGNICNSWKKLSVHMGKHMEQIAMPVLELVNMRDVAPDTVISPIEQNYQENAGVTAGPVAPMVNHVEHQPSLSPYTHSAHSYQNSSAGHSPAGAHAQMRYGYDPGYYGTPGISTPTQGPVVQSEAYPNTTMYSTNTTFPSSGMSGPHQFGSINTQLGSPYPAHPIQTPPSAHSMQAGIPRSQPMGNGYQGNTPTTTENVAYHQQHLAYTTSPEVTPYHQYATTARSHGFADAHEHVATSQNYDVGSHGGENGYLYGVHHVGNNGSFQYS